MVTDYAYRDIAESRDVDAAVRTWLADTRRDLSMTSTTPPGRPVDRAAFADRATLDALDSVEAVLVTTAPTAVPRADARAVVLRATAQDGRTVILQLQGGPLGQDPSWMVTGYTAELAEEWCPQLSAPAPRATRP